MPSRILREGINSSPRINQLSMGAELFYRRLMTVADDYGRYYAAPATLRGACWPISPDKVSDKQIIGWLDECSSGSEPLLKIYEVQGCRYLEVQNFGQQTRSKSKFPEMNCLAIAKQMQSGCEANAQPIRIRISDSDSESYSDSKSLLVSPVGSTPKNANGSRFSLESLPEDWAKFAETDCQMNQRAADREFQRFRDYWIAAAGAKGRKADWFATWRNWCRKNQAYGGSRNGHKSDPFMDRLIELEQQEDAKDAGRA
jgi:hypothetical protein